MHYSRLKGTHYEMEKSLKGETYFLTKNELPGSAYYEFQPGRGEGEIKLDTSIYLYEDMEEDAPNAMAILSYFTVGTHPNGTRGFDMYGITYIDENDGRVMIENLRKFSALLNKGITIPKALEQLGGYDPVKEKEWVDTEILKNTADFLADWSEKTLAEYKMISILGI